ncbi:MAG: methionyl-tRNA formyltransferase [bacterium]|nr:methionyl-tRNA formyltransferase [bacterium]
MKQTKVIFMGTPNFSVPILEYLVENTNVVLVVTKPDTFEGRKKELTYSPIKEVALKNNIDVITPNKIIDAFEIISEINPDIIITCAYGKIVPESILNIPKLGSINVHASILPQYRGASPIQSAILNGDKKTGITIMYMDKGMDTGDIISYEEINIDIDDNYQTLSSKLSLLGTNLLAKTLPDIINHKNNRIKQDDSKATYTRLITREDEKINFSQNGKDIINQIRTFSPNPGAYFKLNDKEIKIIKASFIAQKIAKSNEVVLTKNTFGITCNDGIINLEIVKPFGKNEMNIKAFLNGIDKGKKYVVD